MADNIQLYEDSDFCGYCGAKVTHIFIRGFRGYLNCALDYCNRCDDFIYKNRLVEMRFGPEDIPRMAKKIESEIENEQTEGLIWKDIKLPIQ